MANICITNYVIEGEKKELDALYQTMKEQQENNLGCLVKALGKDPEEVECRGAWTDLERQGDTLLRSDGLAESHLSFAPHLLQSRVTRQWRLSEK